METTTTTNTRKRAGRKQEAAEMEETKPFDPAPIIEMATEYAKENPHIALGAAAAIGFVLGGGLTPRLLGAAAVFAARRYANTMLKAGLDGAMGERAATADE